MSQDKIDGMVARSKGVARTDNPYSNDSRHNGKKADEWDEGWKIVESGIHQLIANAKSMQESFRQMLAEKSVKPVYSNSYR